MPADDSKKKKLQHDHYGNFLITSACKKNSIDFNSNSTSVKAHPARQNTFISGHDPGDECTNKKIHPREHDDECTNTHPLRAKL